MTPPKTLRCPYAVRIDGIWQSHETAGSARSAAWEARGGRGGTPPPICHLTPSGWVELKPGPPKTSGSSGESRSARVQLVPRDEWRAAASKAGVPLAKWLTAAADAYLQRGAPC